VAILFSRRYSPRCAAVLAHAPGRVACGGCGFVGYANSAPTVTALVEDDDGRVLLGRRAIEPQFGKWDGLGGYLEEFEHPLDGLRRELLEETGLVVEPQRFVGVFMGWYDDGPDANATLNLYWTARIVSGELVAADDVAEVAWFAADSLPSGDELAFPSLADALAVWRAGSSR
jgi:ADP-ribose pyrophosphatase YjhB (NUDIX family)